MKKFILPLIAIILLSSCASKFSLQKRRYTKGFYFASAKGNTTLAKETKTTPAKAKEVNLEVPNEEIVKSQQIINPVVTPVDIIQTAPKTSKTTGFNNPKYNTPVSASAENKIIQPEKKFKALQQFAKSIKERSKKGGGGDTNTLLLVIICLFWWFDLIAVFLKDGKKITMNFWLTLLLDFLVIVGIVFAILVVLDVVDFS